MRKPQFYSNLKPVLYSLTCLSLVCLLFSCDNATIVQDEEPNVQMTADPDNGSLTLADGFGAYVVADNLGGARHIAVNDNGDIYIKMRNTKNGGGVVALRDTTGDGRADIQEYFEDHGGTGMSLHNGYIYFSSDTVVYRMKLNNGELVPSGKPEVVVEGFLTQGQHASKPLTFDKSGHMYVTVGGPSNACQQKTRTPGSRGQDPCLQLERQAGIWQFDANKTNQTQQADGKRYATGIRNAVALDWNNSVDELYALQHGRDQLSNLWPKYYDSLQSAELPAEEFLRVNEGDDFGWPYCYYDPQKQQKLLAPEYGGDGQKTGRCENAEDPIMAFPAHWAPNDIVFYNGDMFPEKYKNGAFIAFHGSWNRAPLPQQGYLIAFVPMDGSGNPSGEYERFADQFAGSGGTIENPSDAEFRPTGLATGPDGSLYVTDDQKGRVWRVFHRGQEVAVR